MGLFGLFRRRHIERRDERDGYPLNAHHILGVLYFHGRKRFQCLVMLDAFPLKESFDRDGGV